MDKCSLLLSRRQIYILRESLGSLSMDLCKISDFWSEEICAAKGNMEKEIATLQKILEKAEQGAGI